MDRRRFLMAGLSLSGIAYACVSGSARASGPPTAEALPVVVRESGLPYWPLFEWEQSGRAVMRPPPLAVYGDGTAYADAAVRLALPPVWVKTVQDQALGVLNNPGELLRDVSKPPPPGGGYDQVRARTPAGDFLTARIEGWQGGDAGHAYPPQLRELYQQVQAFRRQVLDTGQPWRPRGVLLGVTAVDHVPHRYRDWPRRLLTPGERVYQEIRLPDGPEGLPSATGTYRLSGNRFVAAGWRYLLPHEIT